MATVTSPMESPEKSPGASLPGEGWPLSSTALVPQPRSLQEAAQALPCTWLWEEKNEKGELRYCADFEFSEVYCRGLPMSVEIFLDMMREKRKKNHEKSSEWVSCSARNV